jgi:hypothetical protein
MSASGPENASGMKVSGLPRKEGVWRSKTAHPTLPLALKGFSGSSMTREVSALGANEVRAPDHLAAPTLHGHRWASYVATGTTEQPSFPQEPYRPGEEKQVTFPPPPPPLFRASVSDSARADKMMKWFQVVEQWCDEGSTADRFRLIAAPPPRPPPWTNPDEIGLFPEVSRPLIGHFGVQERAPYDLKRWEGKCREWWAHIAVVFERLRSEKYLLKERAADKPAFSIEKTQVLSHIAI